MLLAVLASVVIATCYEGDTCTTSKGERVRLACIDAAELRGKRAQPAAPEAARDYLRDLVVGKEVGIRRISEDRYGRTLGELFLGKMNVPQERWSPAVMQRFMGGTPINATGRESIKIIAVRWHLKFEQLSRLK